MMICVASYCNKRSQVFQLWLYMFTKRYLCVMVGVNVVDMSHLNITRKQDICCSLDVQYDCIYCWYCVHYINNFGQLSTVQCTQRILILVTLAEIFFLVTHVYCFAVELQTKLQFSRLWQQHTQSLVVPECTYFRRWHNKLLHARQVLFCFIYFIC